jgi:myo-inositol-1(or 4)-monophosphatase
MKEYLETAFTAAHKAGKIIKDNFRKQKEISYKGKINLVTNIDKKAEETILKIIKKAFPNHNILAEESRHSYNPKEEFCWIIDPLDGTTNYVHQFPFVSVSIALQRNGESVLGVVYNPILEELFYSEIKKGSFKNGNQIYVSKTFEIGKAFLVTGFPYNMESENRNNIANFSKMIKRCRGIRRLGSAAIDLCYVAAGIYDGFWELGLMPWDTAAGILIVEQAGGKITKFDGSAYSVFDKEIVATNGYVHNDLLNILRN